MQVRKGMQHQKTLAIEGLNSSLAPPKIFPKSSHHIPCLFNEILYILEASDSSCEQNLMGSGPHKTLNSQPQQKGVNMEIVMSGHSSSYGECWIEKHGTYYMVILLNGKSRRGPYSQLADALREFHIYCL